MSGKEGPAFQYLSRRAFFVADPSHCTDCKHHQYVRLNGRSRMPVLERSFKVMSAIWRTNESLPAEADSQTFK
jgi:hypothetical protein